MNIVKSVELNLLSLRNVFRSQPMGSIQAGETGMPETSIFSKIWFGVKIAVFVLLVAAVGWGIYNQYDKINQLTQFRNQIGELSKDFAEAKKEEALAKKKLKEIETKYAALLKQRNEDLVAYAELEAKYESKPKTITKVVTSIVTVKETGNDSNSDGSSDGGDSCIVDLGNLPDEHIAVNFDDGRLNVQLTLDRIKENEWDFNLKYKLKQHFRIEVLQTKDHTTGKENMLAKLEEVDKDGKVIGELEITEFNYSSKLNIASGMKWWDPAIALGIHQPCFSQYGWLPVGFLAFSFSKYYFPNKKYPGLRFFQIGFGINSDIKPIFLFTPVLYNLGAHIPLIKDLWIGVDATVDVKARFSVGISISTTL
jgi:hypothetical protein